MTKNKIEDKPRSMAWIYACIIILIVFMTLSIVKIRELDTRTTDIECFLGIKTDSCCDEDSMCSHLSFITSLEGWTEKCTNTKTIENYVEFPSYILRGCCMEYCDKYNVDDYHMQQEMDVCRYDKCLRDITEYNIHDDNDNKFLVELTKAGCVRPSEIILYNTTICTEKMLVKYVEEEQ